MADRAPALEFIKRNWLAVTLFVVLVLVLPVSTFYSRKLFTTQQRPVLPQEYAAPVPTSLVYRTTTVLSLPIGGPSGIGVGGSGGGQYVAFEAAFPGTGGDLWLVDHPAEGPAGARVRRYDSQGRLEVQFNTPAGTTLFTPGLDGDLWVDRSAGSSMGESLMHYSAEGELIKEVELPERLLAGSIEIDKKGRAWIGIAQYWVDPQTGEQRYATELVPVLDENGKRIDDTRSLTVPETFIGDDGNYYSLEGGFEKGEIGELPRFTVEVRDFEGRDLRSFTVPQGLRPFAADAQGRVYAEERAADPLIGSRATVGDEGGETDIIHVYDTDGELVASVPVEAPLGITNWAPSAFVDADGRLYSTQIRDGRFLVVRSEVVDGAQGVAADAKPGPAGARVIVTHDRPASSDPYVAPDVAIKDVWRLVYSGLVSHDASLTAVPDLATAVPSPGKGVSSDGLSITWTIRTDRTWHDGEPVTPADVVATWKHLKGLSAVVVEEPFPGFNLIESVTANSDTVTVRLSEPFGAAPECFFPYVLPAHLVSAPGSDVDLIGQSAPVGSGPYRVARYERDRWMLEAANDAKVGTIQRLDVEFKSVADSLDAYRGSAVPVVWTGMPSYEIDDVRRDAVGTVLTPETGRWFGTVFDARDALVRDTEVRRALSALHPLAEIRTLYGEAPTVTVGLYAPTREGAVVASSSVSMSQKAARSAVAGLLAKQKAAPMANRLPYSQTQRDRVNEVLKEQFDATVASWESVGLTHIQYYAEASFYRDFARIGSLSHGSYTIAAGVFPGYIDAGWGSVFDPSDSPTLANPYGVSVTRTDDSELAMLSRRARASYDPAERAALGAAIQQRAVDLGLVIVERPERRNVAVSGITGVNPAAYPAGDFWDAADWRIE